MRREEQEQSEREQANAGAISDSANPETLYTDWNGAGTAVGVPHPENRGHAPRVDESAIDLNGVELSDYDDDKQDEDDAIEDLPPDMDTGRSFSDIVDVGEDSDDSHPHLPDDEDEITTILNGDDPQLRGTLDNQTNQPEQFKNATPFPVK